MIKLHDLHVTIDEMPILKGIDIEISKGQSVAVLGRSGSGKSVLMRSILGLIAPTSGDLLLNGSPIASQRDTFFQDFGMLFQSAALFDSMRIWENVAFRLLQQKFTRTRARDIAIEKLERVGLTSDHANKFPAELSGGMQKRVGLARAIAHDPSVLFFDEPTTGLDPVMARKIDALIRDIITDTHATALTITHDLASVRRIADQVAFLEDGKIKWHGAVSEMNTAQLPALQAFITASN